MKIKTYQYKTLRSGSTDWSAWDDDTAGADYNGEKYISDTVVGHGRTEKEAIEDLLSQLPDYVEKIESSN